MCLVDIILVKSDPIRNQSSIRAMQIIRSLRKRYSIIGIGWDRQSDQSALANNADNLKLFNLKAPYGFEPYGPLRLVAYFPIFWMWIFIKLCVHRPRCIHACDLATVLPCYLYKVLFGRKLVFDVLDRYGMTYVPKDRNIYSRSLHSLVNFIEETFARNSDVLLAVSDKIFQTFRKKPKNCVTIMNCPEDYLLDKPRPQEVSGYKLLYTGAVRRGRGLEMLSDILTELKDTELIVTGKVKDLQLHNKLGGIPNIKYYGFLDRNELLDLEINSHVMIALYDLKLQNQYEYGVANKVLEAMMCGVAVITNISHELIDDTKCGLIVEYGNVKQIKQSIVTLRDNPELRRLYGSNGRKAFLEKYNWTKMEQKLYKMYDVLLNDKIDKGK
jgi:glycosyltransferase involved in cell wall biosynthesis